MSQKVTQPSRGRASGTPSARALMNGRKPQMKNVVNTSTLRTPCMRELVVVGADHWRQRRVDVDAGVLQRLEEPGDDAAEERDEATATMRRAGSRAGRSHRGHGRASTMILPPIVWCAMPQYSWQMIGYSPGVIEARRDAWRSARAAASR